MPVASYPSRDPSPIHFIAWATSPPETLAAPRSLGPDKVDHPNQLQPEAEYSDTIVKGKLTANRAVGRQKTLPHLYLKYMHSKKLTK
jgi:hypothetical protein